MNQNSTKQIMSNVYWGFYGNKYKTEKDFIANVIRYNNDLENDWNPNEIVLNLKVVTIQYSYWDDSNDEEIEEDFNVYTDNSEFRSGELLFKIHNHVVEKLKDEDHHFFEGLTLWDGENYSNPGVPLYFLNQGS